MQTKTALPDFLNSLKKRVDGELRTDEYSKIFYSTDASIYQMTPHGVLLPKSRGDVQAAVEEAAKFKIPLLARTGGSSLAGQAVNEALVIDFSRHLNEIIEVNREEKWVRVQPGVVLDVLNLHLQKYGLQFGPDPASSNRAAMGGIVSNNSTGSHSIMYGMTADHVLEIKALLSDGSQAHFRALDDDLLAQKKKSGGLERALYQKISEIAAENRETILRGTPKHWRRCGGYNLDRFIEGANFRGPQQPGFNLAKLLSGAEGSLGVITEIKLNLVPRPKKTALAIIQFESLFEALSAVPTILEVQPSAVEMMDNLGLTLCREVPQYARLLKTFLSGQPNCILITEFYGESDKELKQKVEQLEQHLRREKVRAELVPALEKWRQDNVWTVRKVGLGLMMSIKGDHKPIPFIEDAAVPTEYLAEYVTRIEKFCNDLGTNVAYYAHASAGCIHIRPLINAKDARDVEKLPKIGRFSAELLGGYGGSLASEHGDGRCRSWLNPYFYGEALYNLYKEVKQAFDPHNIFNPGVVVNPQDITENLRYGEKYSAVQLQTKYDFSADEGFDRAVEMCNGAGICRKTTTGTMCPSFMATQEEEHSTRGRANALRAAMSGKLPTNELTGKRMFDVMDLCVECKACKAECPSSVDMAKVKFEFLAQYYDKNKTPLRSKVFGNIARISRFGAGRLAPLINSAMKTGLARKIAQSLLGVSAERTLPPFAKQPFEKWFEAHTRNGSVKDAQKAPLLSFRRNLFNPPGKNVLAASKENYKKDASSMIIQGAQNLASKKRVVFFNDTFSSCNEPHIARAAVNLLEKAGYEVILPGHRCCGRPMISKGLAEQAKKLADETVRVLDVYARQGLAIVGLEPSCILTLRDEYLYMTSDREAAKRVAKQSFLIEEFLTDAAENGEAALKFSQGACKILLHGHCHQKSLVGTGQVKNMLNLLPECEVEEVDSGCCGMAGSFGYEAEHYDVSIKMAERRLLPKVREQADDTIIAASGFSCRCQIEHGSGRRAKHPIEILNEALI